MYFGDRWLNIRKRGKWHFFFVRCLPFYGITCFLFFTLTLQPWSSRSPGLELLGIAAFSAFFGFLTGVFNWLFAEWLYSTDKVSKE